MRLSCCGKGHWLIRNFFLALALALAILVVLPLFYLFWTRSLPNGCTVKYANSSQCYIADRNYRVVVDSHIIEKSLKIDSGYLVTGKLASGVSFTLDTRTSTTKYSNGVSTIDGKPSKIKDLPNGYTLLSSGNHLRIAKPDSLSTGLINLRSVNFNDEGLVYGLQKNGLKFQIDTKIHEISFQIRRKNGIIWAARDPNGRIREIEMNDESERTK